VGRMDKLGKIISKGTVEDAKDIVNMNFYVSQVMNYDLNVLN
jgi:hypothetical protein